MVLCAIFIWISGAFFQQSSNHLWEQWNELFGCALCATVQWRRWVMTRATLLCVTDNDWNFKYSNIQCDSNHITYEDYTNIAIVLLCAFSLFTRCYCCLKLFAIFRISIRDDILFNQHIKKLKKKNARDNSSLDFHENVISVEAHIQSNQFRKRYFVDFNIQDNGLFCHFDVKFHSSTTQRVSR